MLSKISGTLKKFLSVLLAVGILVSGLVTGTKELTVEANEIITELQNVALGKTVTGVNPNLDTSSSVVTDGNHQAATGASAYNFYEIGHDVAQNPENPYYIQVDLEDTYPVEKVNMWRYYDDERIYFDTIVFVSEDENFTTEDIVYNSDADNFFGFGAGTDEEYAESAEGKEITFEPRNARYIRVLNNGNDRPWKKGGALYRN